MGREPGGWEREGQEDEKGKRQREFVSEGVKRGEQQLL